MWQSRSGPALRFARRVDKELGTAGMVQRVFIPVAGSTEEERHRPNTGLRLSGQCRTMYQLWTPQAPEAPRVALLDGNSHEARLEAESPLGQGLPKLWIGPQPHPNAWRSFQRPLAWGEVIESLDVLFAP